MVSDLSVLRARCDRLYRKAVTTSVAFLTVLQTYHDERDEEVEAAGFLTSSSSAGRGTSQSIPTGTALHDALKVARDLLDLYADARADLVLVPITSPTDAQIYAEMMHRLNPATAATCSFELVRDEPERADLA